MFPRWVRREWDARPLHGPPPYGPRHAAAARYHAATDGQQTTDLLRRVPRVRLLDTKLTEPTHHQRNHRVNLTVRHLMKFHRTFEIQYD